MKIQIPLKRAKDHKVPCMSRYFEEMHDGIVPPILFNTI